MPLAISLNNLFLENRMNAEVRKILRKTYTFKDLRLRDVEIRQTGKSNIVLATVFTDQEINERQVLMVKQLLERRLSMKLDFKLKVITQREIGAATDELNTLD